MHTKFLSENRKGIYHTEDLIVVKRKISECILGKLFGKMWTGCT
jgi:hypothetical protein